MSDDIVKNFINGEWVESTSKEYLDVFNPSTGEKMGVVPLSTKSELDTAAESAQEAFYEWREKPISERVQYMYRFKQLIETNRAELIKSVINDMGKMWEEADGEIQRTLDVVEYATGLPALLCGSALEDIEKNVDAYMIKQPLGVVASITPFNFPFMVPLWTLPIAISCGNTFILKPSEQTPYSANKIAELLEESGLPHGVLNIVHGAKETVKAIFENPLIKAVSFVGSTEVAKLVYSQCAAQGKKVLALGGAKNSVVIMPDAIEKDTVNGIISSFLGAAGLRCIAGGVLITVGEAASKFIPKIVDAAKQIKPGYGLFPEKYNMGPMPSVAHKQRVIELIESGIKQGAKLLLDGRHCVVEDYPHGFYLAPTVFDYVTPDMTIAKQEIFGPVICIIRVNSFDEAIEIENNDPHGNAASIYTSNGKYAREFQKRAQAGMIGINIGIPAPRDPFAFGGWHDSKFGSGDITGARSIDFWTNDKKITTRWF